MRLPSKLFTTVICLICANDSKPASSEIRPGVTAAKDVESLPLPTQGYPVYMVGEYHGLDENAAFQLQYLERLRRASGLRDVAIEEDAVYERDAQAFVDGTSAVLPPSLCLRAPILYGIRDLNSRLDANARIRVHLTDIDSPAAAIRTHLVDLGRRLGASRVKIPAQGAIAKEGTDTVAQLRKFHPDAAAQSELRTVEFSVMALRQGLEVDLGPPKGSPYLESREEAVAQNIVDLLRVRATPSLLVLYGIDHVSRSLRNDGGPDRNQPFAPVALRLQKAGIQAFSLVTYPLAGQSSWRGQKANLLWTAEDGHLASGETLDKVVSAEAGTRFLYIDAKREHAQIPSDDVSRMLVDAFLLFPASTAMKNFCASR